MAVKAINNTVSFNRLVLTFLIYGVYLRINNLDPFAPSITKRVAVI